jgi:hypothetical protein
MLILIDPALLDPQAHSQLFQFLRHPYTAESCEWVDQMLPDAASAYRSMADSRRHWAAVAREEARYGFDIALKEVPLWRRLLGAGKNAYCKTLPLDISERRVCHWSLLLQKGICKIWEHFWEHASSARHS